MLYLYVCKTTQKIAIIHIVYKHILLLESYIYTYTWKKRFYCKELFASSSAITKGVTGCPFHDTNKLPYDITANRLPFQANNDYNSSYSFAKRADLLTVSCDWKYYRYVVKTTSIQ